MSHLKWDDSKTAAQNARIYLPKLAQIFFASGAEAADTKTPFHAIHRFRLVTKRFRYTLEFFRDYYGPALERRIELLQALQQDLGNISDCSATQKLLADRKDLPARERVRLDRKLNDLANARVAKFRRDWQKSFATQEHAWRNYLQR